jgi:hypothetical protein
VLQLNRLFFIGILAWKRPVALLTCERSERVLAVSLESWQVGLMFGYALLLLTTIAGLLGAPWQIVVVTAVALTFPAFYRQIGFIRSGTVAASPIAVTISFANNAAFTLIAFLLGHGIALLLIG